MLKSAFPKQDTVPLGSFSLQTWRLDQFYDHESSRAPTVILFNHRND